MNLYFKEYGEGQPLLILHGLLGSSGNWHTLSRNVFAKHFRVFTLDLRNHGQSPHSEAMSYENMAQDVRKFAATHELEKFNLLGHSMGGKVAMHMATTSPDLIDNLVVVDIARRAYSEHHKYIFDALMHLDLSSVTSRADADSKLSADISSVPVRQFLLKNLAYDAENGYTWRLNLDNIWNAYSHISDALDQGAFDGKTLFVRGGASDYILESDEPEIRLHFPNSEIRTIEGAGHWVHSEAPDRFADVVLEFLTRDS
ncbi:MAG: alpha/beta fold hydrolase [Rhodothermales bacterium]|nr:alpha/beta fold hydrolase [Rhodothermales bacterium]